MTFENLPIGWPTLPLGPDPLTADVVDLFAREADRTAGALLLLLCDPEHRLAQPIIIDQLPPRPNTADKWQILTFLEHLPADAPALVFALLRPRGTPQDGESLSWRFAVEGAAAQAGRTILGVYLATPGAVRSIERAAVCGAA